MPENCKPLSVECQTCPQAQKCTKHDDLIILLVPASDERGGCLFRGEESALVAYCRTGRKKSEDSRSIFCGINTRRTNWLYSMGYHAGETVPTEETDDVLAGMGYEAVPGDTTK